jgi:hypothetical protein
MTSNMSPTSGLAEPGVAILEPRPAARESRNPMSDDDNQEQLFGVGARGSERTATSRKRKEGCFQTSE